MQSKRSSALLHIAVRHRAACEKRVPSDHRCSCSPTFRAQVPNPHTRKQEKGKWRRSLVEAQEDRRKIRREIEDGQRSGERTNLTVGEAITEFLTLLDAGQVRTKRGTKYKPSARREIRNSLSRYLYRPGDEPEIHHKLANAKLSDVRRADVQRWVNSLDFASQTVRNALNAFRVVARYYVQDDRLTINPCDGILPPAGKGNRFDARDFPSKEEVTTLLSKLSGQERAIYLTAADAGLRMGEIRALDVECVDLDANVIHVDWTYDQQEGKVETKSDAGRRKIRMGAALAAALTEQIGDRTSGPVFPSDRDPSKPFHPSTIGQRVSKLWEDAGASGLTLHQLRHYHASVFIAALAATGKFDPKRVQVRMGHASMAMTMDLYGHLMPGSADEDGDVLDSYLAAA